MHSTVIAWILFRVWLQGTDVKVHVTINGCKRRKVQRNQSPQTWAVTQPRPKNDPKSRAAIFPGTWRREYKEYLPDRTPKSDSCRGVKWMHPTLAFSPNIWIHDIVNSMLLCRLDSKMKVSLESGVQGRLALGASRQHPRHFSVFLESRNGQWEKEGL